MKPTLRKFSPTPSQSFYIQHVKGAEMINPWHYHPEIEIVYIKRSMGTITAGDYIGNFHSGSVFLFGSNLPHTTVHVPHFLNKNEDEGEAISLHFSVDAIGNQLFNTPEMTAIRNFLQTKALRGILLKGDLKLKTASLMEFMLKAPPAKRMISLLTILEEVTHSNEYQQLASKSFYYNSSAHDDSRLKAIYAFTFSNYKRSVNLEELAALTHLTRQSFCRFFKETNRKTYYQFLMEVRIGHACRYLIEDQLPVADIAWRCGYHNMANFIRQFKKITGQSPLQYRKQMRSTLLS